MNTFDLIQNDRVKLNGCPHCGGNDVGRDYGLNGFYFVTCRGCLATGPAVQGQDEAIAAWNRRHDETPSEFERCMK
ncbi:restriction alleviation protein, Lar family [Sinorhizobium meliloti]|uniref:Lar family restriction alleviation protein n=1 Tax=Rhizobium meliloti TaxID=382 RepID=UPI000B49DC17|nr:restriction alleviation protein, Lar family [Sinorhizobium meliloti]MQU85675.1 restriction alleviation protein, Lar family [Sinorhizobium meliloti]